MSVLPYGAISQVRPEYLTLQRTSSDPKAQPGPAAAPTARAEPKALEQAFSAAARHASRAQAEAPAFQRLADTRQVVRQMYRTGRLRGQHAAFEQLWQEGELVPQAKELVKEAKRVDGDVYRLADRQNRDPFNRYLALLEARERLGLDDPGTAQRLDDSLEQAWEAHEAEIMGGFNTAAALMEFARNVEQWNYFRMLYANLMVHDATLASIFKALLEKFGASRLSGAIESLRGAIAADLASPIVNADRVRLVQSQLDLESTRKMSSLVAEGDALCRQVQGDRSTAEQVMRFVGGVLDYVGITAHAEQRFNALCDLLSPLDPTSAMARHRLREFLKLKVPMSLWRSLEIREYLFPAMYRTRV